MPLTITSFTPSRGIVGSGVTIKGDGFLSLMNPITQEAGVYFNELTKASNVEVRSNTELRVTVPKGATTGRIKVANDNRESAVSTQEFTVEVPQG
jgi:hypothetical protein